LIKFLELVLPENGLEDLEWSIVVDAKLKIVFQTLYADCSYEKASETSKAARSAMNNIETSLVYGEVLPHSFFLDVLQSIDIKEGGRRSVFYDLGSGSGRAVFTARLTHDFERCVGIELLPELWELSKGVQKKYDQYFRKDLRHQSVEFVLGDFLKNDDWTYDGTVIFAHSTCFSESMLLELCEKAERLKSGSYFITTRSTGMSESKCFKELLYQRVQFEWGMGSLLVYERI
jgi:SAM-dependent methyltransferase